MMRPIVSIIVPIYNAERTLCATIDSILAQEFEALDIILINDGSTDASLSICKRYAARDNRIRLFSHDNQGVSKTRNVGIENAAAELITFVDADDVVSPDYVGSLYRGFTNESVDLVIAGCHTSLKNCDGNIISLPEGLYVGYNGMQEFISKHINHPLLKVNLSKIYKKSILDKNNIRFDSNMRLSEDALFVLQYMLHINGVKVISDACYFYDMPSSLEWKYRLSIDEAIYKSENIENALRGLSGLYQCDLSDRIKSNWEKSLRCISSEYYMDLGHYNSVKTLYEKHVSSDGIQCDIMCNRYLRSLMQLLYDNNISNELKEQLITIIHKKVEYKGYKIPNQSPWRLLILDKIVNCKHRWLTKLYINMAR